MFQRFHKGKYLAFAFQAKTRAEAWHEDHHKAGLTAEAVSTDPVSSATTRGNIAGKQNHIISEKQI